MQNPFIYGQEVTGDTFCNRTREIRELIADIKSGQNVIVYSPRRYGKTSFVKEALKRAAKEGIVGVYVDLYPVLNEKEFVSAYAGSIAKSLSGPLEKIIQNLKEIFKSIRPKIVINPKGETEIGIDIDSVREIYLEDVAESVKRYSQKYHKRVAVVFDEFQQIGEFSDDKIEKQLRSIIQTHGNKVSYIFMGSKKHMIYDMFSNVDRPFYKSARHFPLEKISKEELVSFVIRNFKKSHKTISKEAAEKIVAIADCHPYYVQHMASSVWKLAADNVSDEIIETALTLTLDEEKNAYRNIWDSITSNQKKALRLISELNKEDKLYSKAVFAKHDLTEASLQRTIKSLIEKDLIDRSDGVYEINDVFFKLWLKRMS